MDVLQTIKILPASGAGLQMGFHPTKVLFRKLPVEKSLKGGADKMSHGRSPF